MTARAVRAASALLAPAFAAAALVCAAAPQAAAQSNAILEVCEDPGKAAADTIRFCGMALDGGGLTPPERARVNVNLGGAFLESGRFPEAIAAFDAAEASDPSPIEIYTGRARAREAGGDAQGAIVDWTRAANRAPRSRQVLLGQGAFFLRRGAPDQALRAFDRAVALDRRDVDAYFNRGIAHIALADWRAAERDFSTVIAADPEDAGAWLNRARARTKLAPTDALADFARALELSPEDGRINFERGKVLDAMGRTEAANRDFRRAYELGVQDEELSGRILSLGG